MAKKRSKRKRSKSDIEIERNTEKSKNESNEKCSSIEKVHKVTVDDIEDAKEDVRNMKGEDGKVGDITNEKKKSDIDVTSAAIRDPDIEMENNGNLVDKDDDQQKEEPENDDGTSSEESDIEDPHVLSHATESESQIQVENEQAAVGSVDGSAPMIKSVSSGPFTSDGRYRNKQRCLVLCSRGVTSRYRHLLEDLRTLIPHHRKDSKLDASKAGQAVVEIAEVKSCNTYVFMECRKRGRDAYLSMGYAPHGPSVKFHLTNVHTMDELRLTGNCMVGSRPILNFDESFERVEHLKLLRILFVDIFGTPRGHPKSKPFVDRIMAFYYADNKIWVRNYQIQETKAANAKEEALLRKKITDGGVEAVSLVEIGPRFVLNTIRIFSNAFWGQTLYENEAYVSPNAIRSELARKKGKSYRERKKSEEVRAERQKKIVVPEDPLDGVFR